MTLSLWRYAHLALAIISSLFLCLLSITGVILAVDAVVEKTPGYRVENFDTLNLAQVVPRLREVYPDIIELVVDHNGFVRIDALDEEGNSVNGFVDPNTGKILGYVKPKSAFIQWVTALHRSLFLHETGRVIVGITSFLLLLITCSGFVLIVKRQQGLRQFFAKINKDSFSQYFHVTTGRWSLLPLLLISITGTYLFMARMDFFSRDAFTVESESAAKASAEELPLDRFLVFKNTGLADLEKLEFPFMEGDPEEFFVLKHRKGEQKINQLTGEVFSETRSPYSVVLEKLSLDLHTGRISIWLAVLLGLASLNILFFIYTGFAITYRRTRTRIKNVYKAEQADIVLLVGSENGSTLFFANQVHKQLLQDGKRAFLAEMNAYRVFPQAEQLLLFTATFGMGDAPTNAHKFLSLLAAHPQQHPIQFSVVGFGSRSYSNFCGYAKQVDTVLAEQVWAERQLPLYCVNDRSPDEFVRWVHAWSAENLLALATAPTLYSPKILGLKTLKVIDKTEVSTDNLTFKISLKVRARTSFQSGDLLAIYPTNDSVERFYSIGKRNGHVQLMVKLHEQGLGSSYLYRLQVGDEIRARLMANPHFHFPKKARKVLMIANGTGIAPFLGMISSNASHTAIHLYAGFRYKNSLSDQYQQFADEAIAKGRLQSFDMAFSREEPAQYVMDLIRRDADFVVDLLRGQGVLMICGALAMQKDVEDLIDQVISVRGGQSLAHYKENGQVLTDCY
ncbi:PepSY domain-containing protein [Sphingobacterium bambusae]|uniref:NADPH--hemoprotein reductase n=1 Tax=Sphingobacterium bambusae TaxID=662858 RepID=A0ABW6BAV3_9SPHI|nr:PepSY domain-containing protein [Sphingobacterium bambusae]WPL48365.1 PepSY domain-containing protein [Sphingobacterium bambusae]